MTFVRAALWRTRVPDLQNASMEPTHSALIVAVAEAEPAVADHRERLDRAATWGVPAHITVLYPFLPPADLEAAATAVREHLPIHARVTSMRLAVGCPDPGATWSTLAEFPLG